MEWRGGDMPRREGTAPCSRRHGQGPAQPGKALGIARGNHRRAASKVYVYQPHLEIPAQGAEEPLV